MPNPSKSKCKKNGEARVSWLPRYERLLIDLWEENLDELRGFRKNMHIYKEFSERFNEMGFTVSVVDIKCKIDNLSKRYRKERNKVETSNGAPSVWVHYTKLHNMLDIPKSKDLLEVVTENTEHSYVSQLIKPGSDGWTEYNAMNVCGQLLMPFDLKCCALKCNFCETIWMRLEDFVNHMQEHKAELADNQLYSEEDAFHLVEDEEVERKDGMFEETCSEDVDRDDNPLESDDELEDGKELIEDKHWDSESDLALEEVDYMIDGCSNEFESDSTSPLDLHDESNRDLILGLIAALKAKSSQWDPEDVKFWKYGLGKNNMKSMKKMLQDKLNIYFTTERLKKTYYEMFRLYCKESCRLKKTDGSKTKPKSKLWFFEEMNFLSKNKPRLIVSDSMMLVIAKVYGEHAPLWDLTNVTYHDLKLKEHTFQNMFREVNKILKRKLTEAQLKERIRKLRKYSIANKRARIESEKTGGIFEPPYPTYLDATSFLNENIRPFFCSECHETVESYGGYVEHMSKHNDGNYYVCKYCDKNHTSAINLKVHMRTHTQELPYECDTCGRKFTNSSSKKKHERIHSGVRPAICDICGKTFRTGSQLTVHIKRHQPGPREYAIKCEICSKSFCNKSMLHQHMNSHFNRREFVCEKCGKGFFSRETLRQHKGLHSTVKKYSCEICGKMFAQYAGKHCHMRITHRRLPLATEDQNDLT